MKSLVLCFYVGPLFFNYCANIAEWSCELWLHFLLYTWVMTPCQQKDDVPTIKTNGFSFPVIHQLLKVVSSIYVFSHMNHDFLEQLFLFFLVCHCGCFWQHFTEYPTTGDISDYPDLSLIASGCCSSKHLFLTKMQEEGDRMGAASFGSCFKTF